MSEAVSNSGRRNFIVLTVLAAVLVVAMTRLGFWQLDRAEEKRALFDDFEAGAIGRAVSIETLGDNYLDRYRRVAVTGRYDAAHQILLDNMTFEGHVGYHVLTPLIPSAGGPAMLVNRGWIPASPRREEIPSVDVAAEQRSIAGRVDRLPRPGIEVDVASVATSGWPRLASFPKTAELETVLGYPLREEVLLLDSAEPDGYVRAWRPPGFGPERHLGYAVQWFALAATLLIIYVVLTLKTHRRNNGKTN